MHIKVESMNENWAIICGFGEVVWGEKLVIVLDHQKLCLGCQPTYNKCASHKPFPEHLLSRVGWYFGQSI